MVHKILGASFFVDIIVAYNVVWGQFQFLAQPGSKLYQGIVSLLVVLACLVRVAGLDGDGVVVAGGV